MMKKQKDQLMTIKTYFYTIIKDKTICRHIKTQTFTFLRRVVPLNLREKLSKCPREIVYWTHISVM